MTWAQVALVVAVFTPWLVAAIVFALGERRDGARAVVGLAGSAVTAFAAIAVGADAMRDGAVTAFGTPLLSTTLGFAVDRLGALFAVVAAVLWLVTTVYAIGYMSHAKDRARFFGFFAICVGSAIGIALSANLLTLFVFYEALTLATYPLVIHSGTPAAINGGRTYLTYALSGGVLLALGVIWLYALGGATDFAAGSALSAELVSTHGPQLVAVFGLLIAGFGVKAAIFPAHGWLPAAMVAPAPVSALLHAVAVVKAGVFGIARVVLDVYGMETAGALGVLVPLAALAGFTIIYASVRALAQDDIKKRLAYSTIGQLSYIVLGLAIGTPLAAAAAIAHLAHHAVLKITMFFTAGVLAEELKVYKVSQMDGVGRRMPLTMLAFSVAALGIVGIPPIAGFVSKWGLGLGGLEAGSVWPTAVLAVSSLLNAAYLLPMLGRAWFGTPSPEWETRAAQNRAQRRPEGDRRMVWPLVLTSLAGLVFGPSAAFAWAPATWAARATGANIASAVPWRFDALGLDETGALYLALAVVVWFAAAVASWRAVERDRLRFGVFFALSAAGSFALAFAQDGATFYACFSVMALSAYGLIAHGGGAQASRAARVYLAFTVVGEALLLAGLLIGSAGEGPFAAVLSASPWRDVGIALLLLAFGIKIGAVGLGGWMPGAYRAIVPGVAAAFAGVVSSAGVLGLIRFVPGGVIDLPGWGSLVMAFGVVAAFYGVVVGVAQRDPRHVLAYSSMSQFGLMTIAIGAGLASAQVWPAAVTAAGLYLVHHGFAKAALFAGADLAGVVRGRRALSATLAIPALALAGLPLTSGAIAKVALKGVAGSATQPWAGALDTLLPLAALGTTLLVARFLVLVVSAPAGDSGRSRRAPIGAFAVLIAAVLGALWVISPEEARYFAHKSLTAPYVWLLTWPVLAGSVVAAVVVIVRRRMQASGGPVVPPGDIWAPVIDRADAAWLRFGERVASQSPPAERPRTSQPFAERLDAIVRAERVLLAWPVASATVIGLALAALALALGA